jgi:hypothetical protein
VVIFKETDCFIYGGAIVGCVLMMFFCNYKMKQDRQKKLAYRIEINRRMKEQQEGLKSSVNYQPDGTTEGSYKSKSKR